MMNESFSLRAQRPLVITRVFEANREKVFGAWTEPEQLENWWGPRNFVAECTLDFRLGGTFLFGVRGPNNQELWNTGAYREIVPLEKIVYTDCYADARGHKVPLSHYGFNVNRIIETLVTVTFEDNTERKTSLTVRQQNLPPVPHLVELTTAAWNESLDKLAAFLV